MLLFDQFIYNSQPVALKKAPSQTLPPSIPVLHLFRRLVLGHSLGSFRDGVLGEFSGKDKADGGLDLAGGDGGAFVVAGELGGFTGNPLEDVVDERVHDGHGLVGDTSVGVDLLEDLVDVGRVGFLSGLLLGFAVLVLLLSVGLCGCLSSGL